MNAVEKRYKIDSSNDPEEILAYWGFEREDDKFVMRDGDMVEVIDVETCTYPYRYYLDRPQYIEPLELNSDIVRAMYLIQKQRGEYEYARTFEEQIKENLGIDLRPKIVITPKEEV